MAGKLIRMFLADGKMEGIKTLEVSNETILCTVFPRPMFEVFAQRKESERPGVYILIGRTEDGISDEIYIGEGDPVVPRLLSHYGKKDFWTHAIVFTSKDSYISKTQIQYIEACLISEADHCGQVVLDNGNFPQRPNISEADEAEVSGFLGSVLLLVKALGYNYFTPLATPAVKQQENEVVFELTRPGIIGKMVIRNGTYTLLSGSTAVKHELRSASHWVPSNRKKLIDKGILVDNGDGKLVLVADAEFSSASGAATIIVGGNVNGLRQWKNGGKTLSDYEIDKNNS